MIPCFIVRSTKPYLDIVPETIQLDYISPCLFQPRHISILTSWIRLCSPKAQNVINDWDELSKIRYSRFGSRWVGHSLTLVAVQRAYKYGPISEKSNNSTFNSQFNQISAMISQILFNLVVLFAALMVALSAVPGAFADPDPQVIGLGGQGAGLPVGANVGK
ncbi:hypothetical protein DdX_04204 [Ditylenchus destructor]|uniref:Uncharacterized protein n=1 Tax=Ditylenchus destructor TaxID=166010 RepID=A0AAD4N950_9BILA|nr:hypothetical protein DdX_04204 [Ditylenchus destructor]